MVIAVIIGVEALDARASYARFVITFSVK